MGVCKSFVLSSFLLILFACSESSILLGGLDDESQVVVRLTAPNALVKSGDEIAISIDRRTVARGDDGTPDTVRIELLDYDGVILATQRYNSVENASTLPSVPIPNLEPGLYRLVAHYEEGDESIFTTEIPIFLVADTYRIRGLSSFPASSFPEADSLLSLSLDIPPGADPYLVWHVNGDVAASGYLSQSGTVLAVAAPQLQGVFPVRVDLYPVWHTSADPAELVAPVRFTSEIFVSENPTVLPTDLGPDEHYFMLYHMRGTLRDSGARVGLFPETDFSGSRFGSVDLAARDRFFGYAFDGRSGIALPGYLWPVYERRFSPVSLSFRLLPEARESTQTLLESDLAGSGGISVVIASDGRVGLQPGESPVVWSELPIVSDDTVIDLTISLIPDGRELVVHFFADGLPVSTSRLPFDTFPPLSAAVTARQQSEWSMLRGETRLGASRDGYVGIIDEFGVFFLNADGAPAADTALFFESIASRYGSSVIVAESFVSDPSASGISFSGAVKTGDAQLVLADGGTVTLPAVDLERAAVRLEIESLGDAELWLGVHDGEGAQRDAYPISSNQAVVIVIRATETGLQIVSGEQTRAIDGVSVIDSLQLTLQASGAERERSVESIVMRYLDNDESTGVSATSQE